MTWFLSSSMLLVACFYLQLCISAVAGSSFNSNLQLTSVANVANLVRNGLHVTNYEQQVDGVNSVLRVPSSLPPQVQQQPAAPSVKTTPPLQISRRLIMMPLSPSFNPSVYSDMHGHIQHGDKCSLPASVGALLLNPAAAGVDASSEFPWIFEIQGDRRDMSMDMKALSSHGSVSDHSVGDRRVVYGSVLDFRAPENYVFVPMWMLRKLDLRPGESVRVRLLPLGMQRAHRVVLRREEQQKGQMQGGGLGGGRDGAPVPAPARVLPVASTAMVGAARRRRRLNGGDGDMQEQQQQQQQASPITPPLQSSSVSSSGSAGSPEVVDKVVDVSSLLEGGLSKYTTLTVGSVIPLKQEADAEAEAQPGVSLKVVGIYNKAGAAMSAGLIQDGDIHLELLS